MALVRIRPALLLICIIFVSNVTSYQDSDNYENHTEENMCYALQEPYRHSLIEDYAESENLQDEISVVKLSLEDTLKDNARCYIEPRDSESLKKILLSTCTPDEEKQI